MQMAIKCQPNNAFAKLILQPYSNDNNNSDIEFGTNDDDIYYQQLANQKENELYNLHSKMDRFHRRISNITSSLKKFHLIIMIQIIKIVQQ